RETAGPATGPAESCRPSGPRPAPPAGGALPGGRWVSRLDDPAPCGSPSDRRIHASGRASSGAGLRAGRPCLVYYTAQPAISVHVRRDRAEKERTDGYPVDMWMFVERKLE